MAEGRPLPKFGEWDVNDPASAEGFTVIFNKARNEKKTGGKPESPEKEDPTFKHESNFGKPQSVSFDWFCSLVYLLNLVCFETPPMPSIGPFIFLFSFNIHLHALVP
ncbi:hypothetical protein F0562_008168 [Nyssa sinensis]|uniref:RIN4 pathogenic type III effector avirulence factor Avr cleavage site domain-containing protein n=1 Tax=Nyssa sinensis TaxID=561372 RepID=A0A5J5A8J7_9ASTE|nr:hypothetical protein F0562_008168 [Nyssa sinensis]